jgi:hypothetical protein
LLLAPHLVAHNAEEPDVDEVFRQSFGEYSAQRIPLACRVAALASRRRRHVYAITKYAFSVRLYGVFIVDLEPFRSTHLRLSPMPDDHVVFANAIVSAYSAIEDLGLEIRASASKPSRVGGEWNPVVRAELEQRLDDAGVDRSNGFLWTVRGRETAVHAKRSVQSGKTARWSHGLIVRDRFIDMCDAIAYADWLRDCVASHASKGFTPSLSPYDVINVQHLARQLVLSVLGEWRPKQSQS